MTPYQKMVGLKLCWVVFSFVRRGRVVGDGRGGGRWWGMGGVNSINRVKPNLKMRLD